MPPDNVPHTWPAESGSSEQMDAANKSLADALRFSFWLLSVIMIFALGALLLTGLATIEPQEAGLRLLFGRIQGSGDERVLGEGLRLAWPQPVGRVERVSVKSQKLKIDDFWMYEKPEEMNRKLSDRQAPMGGLRPGHDGALLTGDRGLVHVKFTCWYSLKAQAAEPGKAATSAVISYLSNIADPKEAIRSAVCNAAIHASATRTVEAIYSTSHDEYIREIRDLAQKQVDALESGIRIDRILVNRASVPIAAIAAFNAVTSARLEGDTAMNKARGRANTILRRAAGANWKKLIGNLEEPGLMDGYASALKTNDRLAASTLLAEMDEAGLLDLYPEIRRRGPAEAAAKLLEEIDRAGIRQLVRRADKAGKAEAKETLEEEIERIGLLRLYARARESKNQKLSAELLKEINETLMSHETTGEAASVIQAARGYSAEIREQVKARAESFQRFLSQFERDPELMLSRLWADVKQGVLTSPTNRKWYLTPGKKLNLMLSEPPEISRRIEEEQLKKDREKQERRRTRGRP